MVAENGNGPVSIVITIMKAVELYLLEPPNVGELGAR